MPLEPTLPELMPLRRPALMIAAALAVYWLLLVLATHLPIRAAANASGLGLDKVVHFSAYAGLAALGYLLATAVWRPSVWVFAGVIAAAALHAALDEWTQGFVPHRSADLRDWLADVAGAITGTSIAAALRSALARRAMPLSEPAQP